jgi:exoribonuclease R
MHAILLDYNLPIEFPEAVEREANAIPMEIPAAEIKKRRDFRDIVTFTIDPIDAKDFDDALSVRKLENGNWEVILYKEWLQLEEERSQAQLPTEWELELDQILQHA